jgi:hypothetical protein
MSGTDMLPRFSGLSALAAQTITSPSGSTQSSGRSNRIYDTEDRRVRTDPQRERHDRDQTEPRSPRQRTNRLTEVTHEIVHGHSSASRRTRRYC